MDKHGWMRRRLMTAVMVLMVVMRCGDHCVTVGVRIALIYRSCCVTDTSTAAAAAAVETQQFLNGKR